MKKIGSRLTAAALAVMLAAGSGGCAFGGDRVTISRSMSENEVFSIGGGVCRLSVMKLLLLNNMNLHGESYGIDLLQNEDLKVQKKFEQYIKQITMDELTQIYAMAALAEEQQITLTDEQKELVRWAGEDCFRSLGEEQQQALGITQEELQEIYEKYALAELVAQALTDSVNEEVSDDEARVLELRQIYTTAEDEIRQAHEELLAEQDFSAVAANYNEADEIALTVQRGDLPQAAETAAFSMEDGEISDIIQTDDGYYIFCCDNKYDEEQTQLHKQDIIEQRRYDAVHSVYDPYVKELHSRLNKGAWEAISIRELEQYPFADFQTIYDKYMSEEH